MLAVQNPLKLTIIYKMSSMNELFTNLINMKCNFSSNSYHCIDILEQLVLDC